MAIKNLFERAHPDLVEKLDSYSKLYPHSGDFIKKELEDKCFITDLPYGVVLNIQDLFCSAKRKVDLFKLFKPAEIHSKD